MAEAALALVPDAEEASSIESRVADAGRLAVEAIADGFLEKVAEMDLEGISRFMLQQGQKVTAAMMGAYLDGRGASEEEQLAHPCPGCGKRVSCREGRKRTVDTRHGTITFERPYFHCRSCGSGFFPMDDDLRLAAKAKQHDMSRLALRLLAEMPYKTAAEIFKEATGLEYSDHCMHGLAENFQDQCTIDLVLPTRTEVEATIEQASGNFRRPVVVVSADGAHEPCRPYTESREKARGPGYWREAKGFRVYLLTKSGVTQIASWHQIMNEEEFGNALDVAAGILPQEKIRIALIADGAPWLWAHLERAFPEGKPVLDYYHVSEHVHKVAKIQYGDETQAAREWAEATMGRLWAGEVGSVTWGLERMKPVTPASQEEIRKLRGYLEKNAEKINYSAFRRGGYPIGSGGIESANKFICHIRIKRSGAWWYEHNANGIMRIRCAKFNGTLDRIVEKYKATSGKKRRPRKKRSI